MQELRYRLGTQRGEERLRRLVERVPGFTGYTRKEERSQADRVLRTHVAERLDEQCRQLEGLQEALTRNNLLGQLAPLEAAIVRLQSLAEEIRTASDGAAGWFDAEAVDESELATLYEHDMSLAQGAEWVEANCGRLFVAIQAGDEAAFAAAADDLNTTLDRLADRVVARREAVSEAKRPAALSPRQLLTSLQQILQQGQSLMSLRPGDGVSQGGADYVVRGTAVYQSRGEEWHAYMLQNGEESWLWLSDAGRRAYLATPVPAPEEMAGKTEVDWQGETLSVIDSGAAIADVEGPTGRGGGILVDYWHLSGPSGRLLWLEKRGEQISAFLGEPIDPADIAVWQQPAVSKEEK